MLQNRLDYNCMAQYSLLHGTAQSLHNTLPTVTVSHLVNLAYSTLQCRKIKK